MNIHSGGTDTESLSASFTVSGWWWVLIAWGILVFFFALDGLLARIGLANDHLPSILK